MKAMSKKQLREAYGISAPTLNKWLLRIPGIRQVKGKRLFTPLQVKKIIDHLGLIDEN